MKRNLLTIILLLTAALAWSVPARRDVLIHTQKDGTVLRLTLVGDEHMHYYHNTATGQIMQQGDDGDFRPVPPATLSVRRRQAQLRRAAANRDRMQRLPRITAATSAAGMRRAIGSFTGMTGTKKGLVILVEFQDVKFKAANNQAAFDNQFNQQGYTRNNHIGSVKDYFTAQSYGNFTVDFDVVGPVTVSQNMAYYGANDSNGNDEHPAEMIIEAVKLADTQCGVDYTLYDWGGNGSVDQVFVIYAGYNEAQGAPANTIWPHEWTLASANHYGDGSGSQRIDGKRIDTYACTSELCGKTGSTMDGIGTACHEFSHCLGYPDLYDTSGGGCWGMDAFDLMSYGSYNGPAGHGEVPCGYSAYQRWMAGWLTPVELTAPVTVTNMPPLNDQAVAYIIRNDATQNEYLLLENRQNNNWFRYLRQVTTAHGLLVTHVDYNATAWTANQVNIYTSHERFEYIAADKTYSSGSFPADCFPGTGRVTSLTSTTHTSAGGVWFNNTTAGSTTFNNQDITNITESNGKISFDFNGGSPVDAGTRYTVTLDPCGAGTVEQTSWTQTYSYSTWALPTPVCSVPDWVGIGWSKARITADTPIDDIIDDIIADGTEYLPDADVTLYAVYANNDMICNSTPVAANHEVTFSVSGGTCPMASFTQTAGTRTVILPEVTPTVAGWTFAGWSATPVAQSDALPTLLAAGTAYLPTADVSLYAVFTCTVTCTPADGLAYRLVDGPTAGYEYVIACSNAEGGTYVLDAANITSTAQESVAGSPITIAGAQGTIAIASAQATQVWTIMSNGTGKWLLKNGDKYLRLSGTGFSLQDEHNNLNNMFWHDTYGLYGKSSSGSSTYYVHSTGQNISNSQTAKADDRVYLYEYVAGNASATYYSSTPTAQYHTVTFNAGAGTCDTTEWTQDDSHTSVTLPTATIAISGWTFAGWAAASVAHTTGRPALRSAGTAYTPMGDVTLFAVYTAISHEGSNTLTHYDSNPTAPPASTFYTITYNAGGGTVDPASWTQSLGDYTATLPAAAYEGWTFFGWASAPVAHTTHAPSVRAPGSTLTPVTNTTLYAVYKNSFDRYTSTPGTYVATGGTEAPQFYYPYIIKVHETFAGAKLITDSEGTLTYASSDEGVAKVDAQTGEVTGVAPGTAIITVTQAATAHHLGATATYMVKVIGNR